MALDGKADFRSDTVTRPTPEMEEAMRRAELGDDVFADDPTVNELQRFAAELFGKQAALFCPSGTMANQIAIRVQTSPGDEVVLEEGSHTYLFEQGGMAALHGVQAHTLKGRNGVVPIEDLAAALRPDTEHFPVSRLIVIENTHNMAGGAVLPLEYLRAVRAFADEHGLRVHLDGARIANAEAATGIPLAEWAACADTVSCCLSKGLAAPIGTILLGDATTMRRARRARKVLGGGMRQAGVIAAAGIIALRDMRGRLKEDHARARRLAEGLAAKEGVRVAPPETNLVYVETRKDAGKIAARLEEEGVRTVALGPHTLRFVTHKDVHDDDVQRALEAPVSYA